MARACGIVQDALRAGLNRMEEEKKNEEGLSQIQRAMLLNIHMNEGCVTMSTLVKLYKSHEGMKSIWTLLALNVLILEHDPKLGLSVRITDKGTAWCVPIAEEDLADELSKLRKQFDGSMATARGNRWSRQNIKADGNCLYRACSVAIYGQRRQS